MKTDKLKQYFLNGTYVVMVVLLIGNMQGCSEDPVREDTPELITKAVLTFTPAAGGFPVVVTATDPDGEGVQDIVVDGDILLAAGASYTLTLELFNELADPSDAEYNITSEIEEEADEHMFFFSWTAGLFSDPGGNGNVDNRDDEVNYEDEDGNGLPLGLETSWTTGTASSGKFRIVLKHQPDNVKTETSGSGVGETDLDIEFDIEIQ